MEDFLKKRPKFHPHTRSSPWKIPMVGVLLELSERSKIKRAKEREHNIIEYKKLWPFLKSSWPFTDSVIIKGMETNG